MEHLCVSWVHGRYVMSLLVGLDMLTLLSTVNVDKK